MEKAVKSLISDLTTLLIEPRDPAPLVRLAQIDLCIKRLRQEKRLVILSELPQDSEAISLEATNEKIIPVD